MEAGMIGGMMAAIIPASVFLISGTPGNKRSGQDKGNPNSVKPE